MARIAGVDIPREKRVEISLCYIFGIGLTTSRKILEKTRVNPDTRVKNLTEEEVNRRHEHQAADRNWLLSWSAPSSQPSSAWTAHANQCAYTPWAQENGRRQEEIS